MIACTEFFTHVSRGGEGMKTFVSIVFLLSVLSHAALAIDIDRVEVEGNFFVSDQKIRSIFGLRAGTEYKADAVSQGIRRLFQTKDFSDIVVWYREEDGKVVLTLRVDEYPRVKEVRIEGNKHIKREDIEGKLIIREGFFARPSLITQDVFAIKELYSEKGYNSAKIDVKRIPLEKEHRIVISYSIEEGEKVKIRHIDFLGNGAIESKELRDVLESQEDRWWRGGELKLNILEEDLKRIKQLYGNKGHLDAMVFVERQVEIDGGKHVDIYIRIDEGQPYYVGNIEWSGNSIVPDDEIEELITLERGDPFSIEQIELAQVAINGKYWEKGYIWSRIIPERNIHGKTIDLSLRIIENNPASINEIKISGNTKTFESVIRRELRVYPGDQFILGEVQRSLRDIFALGYFNGPPRVDTEPVNEEGDINLLIEVDEKQTGYFRMGTGFSQLNSLSGFLGVSENNLFGRGKSASLDWEFGKWRKNLNFRYSEPYFLGTETALTLTLFNWIQDRVRQQYYTDRRKGFSIQVGRPFPLLDYTRIFMNYRFETVELSNFSTAYPEFGVLRQIEWPLNKSSVMLSLSRNSTDNPFHPTKGSISNISAEFAGGLLQGNVKYMRYMGSVSWFRNLFWKFTLHLKMQAGVIDGYNDALQVHDFERFRLGGNRRYALRGYDFFEVVPEGNDPFIGGRFMTTFTQEIVFPFTEQVHGLVFLDAGNTWNSFRDADLFILKRGLGLGVRLEMPGLGNLGFDYGYGFDKVDGPAWEPHFTFGTFF